LIKKKCPRNLARKEIRDEVQFSRRRREDRQLNLRLQTTSEEGGKDTRGDHPQKEEPNFAVDFQPERKKQT